jgi:hypothetical protein
MPNLRYGRCFELKNHNNLQITTLLIKSILRDGKKRFSRNHALDLELKTEIGTQKNKIGGIRYEELVLC